MPLSIALLMSLLCNFLYPSYDHNFKLLGTFLESSEARSSHSSNLALSTQISEKNMQIHTCKYARKIIFLITCITPCFEKKYNTVNIFQHETYLLSGWNLYLVFFDKRNLGLFHCDVTLSGTRTLQLIWNTVD